MEQRAALKLEAAILRAVDLGTGQVCRQQVGGELDTVKIAFDAFAEHLDRARLGKPGSAFDQQMTIGQDRD